MTMSIREDTVRLMMTIMPKNEEDTKRKQVAEITSTSGASDGSEKGRTVRKGAKMDYSPPDKVWGGFFPSPPGVFLGGVFIFE